jgi:hypothetical protein
MRLGIAGARATSAEPALRSARRFLFGSASSSHARLAWAPRPTQFAAARPACKARAPRRLCRSLTGRAYKGPRLRLAFRPGFWAAAWRFPWSTKRTGRKQR